jgi:tRNA (guanine37-N1)-methyltransferase
MKIDILTIFPDYFTSPLKQSLLAKAGEKGLADIKLWDIRDFAKDRHKMVDDEPYGGGAGMVMKIEPLCDCLREAEKTRGAGYKILLSPQGRVFSQQTAFSLSNEEHLIMICGRYEGVDDRIHGFIDDEISIGDYVVMGGETAVLVITEAISRLIPGVVGKEESVNNETFADGLLEYPQYTRPAEYEGAKVPDILLSGDHKKIREWRLYHSMLKTYKKRPDLIEKLQFDNEKRKMLERIKKDDA